MKILANQNQSLRAGHLEEIAVLAVVLVSTLFSQLPSKDCEFLNWDDDRYVTENPDVRELNLHNIALAFSGVHFESYHPLHLVSYMIDATLWPNSAMLYRMHNLALFVAATALLYFLLRRLGWNAFPSAIGCLFFSLAPTRVESVSWITSRKDVLCLLFAFVFWHLHLSSQASKQHRLFLIAAAFIAFMAALLSKSAAMVMPAIVFAADICLCRQPLRKAAIPAALYSIPAIIIAAALPTIWAEAQMIRDPIVPGLSGRSALVGWTFWHYVKTALWPFDLCPIYADPQTASVLGFGLLGSAMLLLAIGYFVYSIKKGTWRSPWSAAAACFLVGLVPFLNCVPLYYIVADRYLLFPSIGIAILAAACAGKVETSKKRVFSVFLCAMLAAGLVSFAVFTHRGCLAWQKSSSLWHYATERQPDAFFARLKYAETLRKSNDAAASAFQYREARKIRPMSRVALGGLFWASLLSDSEAKTPAPFEAERLVSRFLSIADDAAKLSDFALYLKTHGFYQASKIVVERINER